MKLAHRPNPGHLRQLCALDAARLSSLVRRPTVTASVALLLPLLVLSSALWMFGRVGGLEATGVAAGLTLGMLVSAPIAFMAYGLLFRGGDDGFLRHLGIGARAFFLERSARLAAAGAVTAAALVVPFLSAGDSVAAPLAIGISTAAAASGTASLTYAWAAMVASTGRTSALLSVGIRKFDPGLAKAAPLVYAPLVPFLIGAGFGAIVGASGTRAWLWVGVAVVLGSGLALLGARVYVAAAPRFFAVVREMAYSPPPEGEGEAFRIGRGLSALLPARAAAVWVRDATVAGRRFAWAARVTWPVAIVSLVTLARWGGLPTARMWVVAAVGLALVIQGAAIVGLGKLERRGPRWIDRSAGLLRWERFLGRWAFGWGLSLWLLVPVSLAWAWWGQVGAAWVWPLAGALTAAVAATVSLLSAEPR